MKHIDISAMFPGRTARRLMGTSLAVGAVAVLALAASDPSAGATAWVDPAGVSLASATSQDSAATFTRSTVRYAFRTIDDQKDATFNQLLGINDDGRIAGYFGSGADATHPNKGYVVGRPYAQRNFVNENVPGSTQTQVVGIDDRGTTVGFYVDAAGANVGFVRRDGRFTSISNPATAHQTPFDQLLGINNGGIAVGFYNDANGASHGYTYNVRTRAFSPVTLPVAADSVVAAGINDHGDVSGFYTVGKVTRGFLIVGGHFITLQFGGKTNTQAFGVDNSDQVVGSFLDKAGAMHGFLLTRGRLSQVDDPNGAAGSVVNGLNNRGRLVGFYVDRAGLTHGFLAQQKAS